MSFIRHAFTLVEILIVVVILGILTAIVVPRFTDTTEEVERMATLDQLVKVRNALGVYYVRNNSRFPTIVPGNGTWGELIQSGGDYLREPPRNLWVGGPNATVIVFGTGPDPGYQTTHGWIYNPATGQLWAGSFDDQDRPYPRP